MNKIKLLLDVVQDMRSLADSIQAFCDEASSKETEQTQKATTKRKTEKEPQIALEKVRGVLAEKSQLGFTAEVRAIIQKYGANRLSEVDPKNYKNVLEDAEVLGNG